MNIEVGSKYRNLKTGIIVEVLKVKNDVVTFENYDGGYFNDVLNIDDFLESYMLWENAPVKQDMVNHPPHYKDKSGVECIEVTRNMGFGDGNCFKYLYRVGKKSNTIEDLEKALWYADDYRENENYLISLYRSWRNKKKILKIAKSRWETGQWRVAVIMEKIAVADWERAAWKIEWLIQDIKQEISGLGYSPTLNEIEGLNDK